MSTDYLDEGYWSNLPSDPIDAAVKISADGQRFIMSSGTMYEEEVEAFGMASEFVRVHDFIPVSIPELGRVKDVNQHAIAQFFAIFSGWASAEFVNRTTTEALARARRRFGIGSGTMFAYHFDEREITEIQDCLNELRDLIGGSSDLTEEHKARILSRLEQLQTEIHKNISDLDRFWGLVGDAGVVIKKFGENTREAAAIVALIYKISMFAWNAQLDAHDLPRSHEHPLLPAPPAALPSKPVATLPPRSSEDSDLSEPSV